MNNDALMQYRRDRLDALAKHMGGRAALGRALGYKDGAYINHMINGLRPVTEKTIADCEKLPGCQGWFSSTAFQEKALSRELIAAISQLDDADIRRIENMVRAALDLPQLRNMP